MTLEIIPSWPKGTTQAVLFPVPSVS